MINPQHQTSPKIEHHQCSHGDLNPGATLQAHLLDGVSRTFALTIPQLPSGLHSVVSNNYLLCRIIDTIEDEPALTWTQKQYFSALFLDVVSSHADAAEFSKQLAPMLSDSTIPAEHELIQYIPQVINITTGFNRYQRKALEHCVKVMGEGMVAFQSNQNSHGLTDLSELDRYCYHVAGIVGETLTKLFCNYSEEIAKNETQMMNLAVSFGQGLQMTNILKDIWDDQERGACWLPRDIFKETGFDLEKLVPGHYQEDFGKGLVNLIGIARRHLNNAIDYTLLIPSHETGIRNFCLWAIGMAVLTLRKIYKHRNFSSGQEVKITRRSVKATVFTSRLAASHDLLVRSIFSISSLGLPAARTHFAN
jgi:farnesyl-diphosphate farnesyltransferase